MRKKIRTLGQLFHGGTKHVVLTVKSGRHAGENLLRSTFDISIDSRRVAGKLPVESYEFLVER